MATSILTALINIFNYRDNDLNKIITSKTRRQPSVNIVGEPLDFYFRDALCNTFKLQNILAKKQAYDKEFSYYGHQNSPPDIIIKGSDAIEVKKLGSFGAKEIQLNSSCPKSKLYPYCSTVSDGCATCEPGWKEKDMVYTIGYVIKDKISLLTIVYGNCFATDYSVYEALRSKVISGINNAGLNLSVTNEIGRVNNVDPLKLTALRIRGMWLLTPPLVYFKQYIKPIPNKSMSVYCIMRSEKFNTFQPDEKSLAQNKMRINNILIKEPSDPRKNVPAKLISFFF